jgi:hypothetical protein
MGYAFAKKNVFLPRLNLFDLQESTLVSLAGDPTSDPALLDRMGRLFLDRPKVIEKLIENGSTPQETLILIGELEDFRSRVNGRLQGLARSREPQDRGVFAQIQKMTVAEKIQLALKGGREARTLLIKDPNKLVARNVLASPKVTDQEIELFAQSKNVSDEVLRVIAANANWVRNYNVVLSLASNPRTPLGITLGLVNRLKTRDLGVLSKNRSVPDALRSAAAKLLKTRKPQG